MKKCQKCVLKDAKPCYECSMCMGGNDHFRPMPDISQKTNATYTVLRSVPAGEPLTIEQLREMNGQPVWVQTPGIERYGRWVIVAGVDTENGQQTLYCREDYTCRNYGITWLAYAYPPAHIDREAWAAEWEESGECNHKPYRVRDAAKWKKYKCSKCGYKAGRLNSQNYCPSCGRAMNPESLAILEKRLRGEG